MFLVLLVVKMSEWQLPPCLVSLCCFCFYLSIAVCRVVGVFCLVEFSWGLLVFVGACCAVEFPKIAALVCYDLTFCFGRCLCRV